MTDKQQPSWAKEILPRSGIGNLRRDDDKLDAEPPRKPKIWVVKNVLCSDAWKAAETGQPIEPTDRIYIDETLMADQSKIPQLLADVLRQAGTEADFAFEPPRLGDIVATTLEELE